MTHLFKMRINHILRWVSVNFDKHGLIISKGPCYYNVQKCCSSRFYCRDALNVKDSDSVEGKDTLNVEDNGSVEGKDTFNVEDSDSVEGSSSSSSFCSDVEKRRRVAGNVKKEAQRALLEYFHCTRYLHFMDAEHMSKSCPQFIKKLVAHVGDDPDVGHSITRFLRYHPVNEFEPFFESIGLKPKKLEEYLLRDLMFLCDEEGLLDNYHALVEYGVARNKIGSIYREAREVFRYGDGVLQSKLHGMEEIGLCQDVVAMAISFSPYILIGDVSKDFAKVVQKLKCIGFDYEWIQAQLVVKTSYNWSQIHGLFGLFNELNFEMEELRKLIGEHPELLFDSSGRPTFSLLTFALKFGFMKNDIRSVFLELPPIKLSKFVCNLRRAFMLFTEIEMNAVYMRNIVRSHVILLGSISLKRASSILSSLSTGNRRLRKIVIANPLELKKWVLGQKIEQLPDDGSCYLGKVNFLLNLGFVENSKEMDKALKAFRGKGQELQERFDCMVKAGLSPENVALMVKTAPQILNLSKEAIEAKLKCLVDELGFPLSSIRTFPGYICYTTERVKLRYSMYRWLCNHKAVNPSLSLCTFIACTEPLFMKRFVKKHPRGPEVWQELKNTISSA